MSTIRKSYAAALFVVFSFCFTTIYMVAPAEADGPGVVLASPPAATPLPAAPTVRRAKLPGYIRACEPTRAHDGRKTILEYGKRGTAVPDGRKVIRTGECRRIAVHRHRIFWISYDKLGRVTGHGTVRHIHLS